MADADSEANRRFLDFLVNRISDVFSEREVGQKWRDLFKGGELSDEKFVEAEELLNGLRLESPLRHRLSRELDELRQIVATKK